MKTILVVGPSVPEKLANRPGIIHHPLIKLEPCPQSVDTLQQVYECSSIIITSKHAVQFFVDALRKANLPQPLLPFFCIGKSSAQKTKELFPASSITIAQKATQEGMVETICKETPRSLFWPRSSKARTHITTILPQKGITVIDLPLYEPIALLDPPSLNYIEEILFTCPSSVDAFFAIVPRKTLGTITLRAIGPITEKRLFHFLQEPHKI